MPRLVKHAFPFVLMGLFLSPISLAKGLNDLQPEKPAEESKEAGSPEVKKEEPVEKTSMQPNRPS